MLSLHHFNRLPEAEHEEAPFPGFDWNTYIKAQTRPRFRPRRILIQKSASVVTMSSVEDEPWPPVPPDMSYDYMAANNILEDSSRPFIVHQHQLYKTKDGTKVYKMGGEQRGYDLHRAAGDCAIKTHGRVLSKMPSNGIIDYDGYFMDLATPLSHFTTTSTQRKQLIQEMVQVIGALHNKHIIHGDVKLENMLLDAEGHVKLCDFEEGRFEDEDEETWEGNVTWHYVSPNRRRREEDLGRDAPPRKEDDLYGLGVSIWSLYTGQVPFEEIAQDDLALREVLLRGETVDVDLIDDEYLRDIVKGYLRQGGARI
ncbi:kinase-like domain-containing protein [Diaporthe sp. PMI_573]|nr:kinase-like domain-containing protein [Diaporthaceae sp. PMI_573]